MLNVNFSLFIYLFDRLPMLKSLDVSFNMIQKLPDEIESATNLPVVTYDNNLFFITQIAVTELLLMCSYENY